MAPLDLRRAFGRFGTGVTVVTTRTPDGQRLGVTANSFNTVSLAPPIVLWSLHQRSPSLSGFRAAGRFVVNVLAGCAASIECRIVGDQHVGDHILFLGEVEHYAHATNTPLLFCNGQYQQGVSLNPAPAAPGYRPASKGNP